MKNDTLSRQVRLDLPITQRQLVSLVLALDATLAAGVSDVPDCFPSTGDLACLKLLSDRCWKLLCPPVGSAHAVDRPFVPGVVQPGRVTS